MQAEKWLTRALVIILLLVSTAQFLDVDTPLKSLWLATFGVTNCLALWMISNMFGTEQPTKENATQILKPPYDSVELASLMIDISQFIGRPLTYKQLSCLLFSVQAQTLYSTHTRLIKDDFWLINGRITTRGVETSFYKYKGEIKDKMQLSIFPKSVPARVFEIVKDFDDSILDVFDSLPQIEHLKKVADANGGLITDAMMTDFWRRMLEHDNEA